MSSANRDILTVSLSVCIPFISSSCLIVGGQSCCFKQAAAVLFFSCSSVWSAPPSARWGNSVLNAVLCARDQLQDPPPSLLWEVGLLSYPHCQLCAFPNLCWVLLALWEVGLSPHSHSQPFLFYGTSVPRVGFLAPPLTAQQWEISSLPHPHSPGQVQHSIPPQMVVVDYSSLFMAFSFAGGGRFSLLRGCTRLFSQPALEPAGMEKWHCCFQCSLA
jgi:hypothetical protein